MLRKMHAQATDMVPAISARPTLRSLPLVLLVILLVSPNMLVGALTLSNNGSSITSPNASAAPERYRDPGASASAETHVWRFLNPFLQHLASPSLEARVRAKALALGIEIEPLENDDGLVLGASAGSDAAAAQWDASSEGANPEEDTTLDDDDILFWALVSALVVAGCLIALRLQYASGAVERRGTLNAAAKSDMETEIGDVILCRYYQSGPQGAPMPVTQSAEVKSELVVVARASLIVVRDSFPPLRWLPRRTPNLETAPPTGLLTKR